jgi:hypothetical protein
VINVVHDFPVTELINYKSFPVTEGSDGRIYGLTDEGGTNHKGGVYALNADGTGFTVLYECPPTAKVVATKPAFGPDGKLYIVISGILCSMNTDGSAFSSIVAVPHSFNLQEDSDGWIYGIGTNAGQNSIYKVMSDGSGVYRITHLSSCYRGQWYNKRFDAYTTEASDGRLYDTTTAAGPSGMVSFQHQPGWF